MSVISIFLFQYRFTKVDKTLSNSFTHFFFTQELFPILNTKNCTYNQRLQFRICGSINAEEMTKRDQIKISITIIERGINNRSDNKTSAVIKVLNRAKKSLTRATFHGDLEAIIINSRGEFAMKTYTLGRGH